MFNYLHVIEENWYSDEVTVSDMFTDTDCGRLCYVWSATEERFVVADDDSIEDDYLLCNLFIFMSFQLKKKRFLL